MTGEDELSNDGRTVPRSAQTRGGSGKREEKEKEANPRGCRAVPTPTVRMDDRGWLFAPPPKPPRHSDQDQRPKGDRCRRLKFSVPPFPSVKKTKHNNAIPPARAPGDCWMCIPLILIVDSWVLRPLVVPIHPPSGVRQVLSQPPLPFIQCFVVVAGGLLLPLAVKPKKGGISVCNGKILRKSRKRRNADVRPSCDLVGGWVGGNEE